VHPARTIELQSITPSYPKALRGVTLGVRSDSKHRQPWLPRPRVQYGHNLRDIDELCSCHIVKLLHQVHTIACVTSLALLIVSGGCFAVVLPDVHLAASWWMFYHRDSTPLLATFAPDVFFLYRSSLLGLRQVPFINVSSFSC
jgi:hypothetical protein